VACLKEMATQHMTVAQETWTCIKLEGVCDTVRRGGEVHLGGRWKVQCACLRYEGYARRKNILQASHETAPLLRR